MNMVLGRSRRMLAQADALIPGGKWQIWRRCASLSRCINRHFAAESGKPVKGKLAPLQERKMVDRFRVHVRGGDGGAGCTSFQKSRHSRHGVADGGNGGRGGNVILISSSAVWDLSNLQHHLNGTKGGAGSSKRRVGTGGFDKIAHVPVGTVIHLTRGSIPYLEMLPNVTNTMTWEDWEHSETGRINKEEAGSGQEGSGQDIFTHNGTHADDSNKVTKQPEQSLAAICHSISRPREAFDREGKGARVSKPNFDSPVVSPRNMMEIEGSFSELDEEDSFTDEDEDATPEFDSPVERSSVAEFVKVGESLIVACGGQGGRGNAAVARGRGSEKQLSSLEHEPGLPGSEAYLVLELKIIADVGLVGAPNAGKSTLLGALSRAKPITGHYKFTTLRPNVGKIEYQDFSQLSVADIPGLIRGAHENRGLGHAFLRHIERTKALVYVVDLSAGHGDSTEPLPWDQFQELVFELEQYKTGLSDRPSILVANKIDEEGAEGSLAELRRRVPQLPIYPVCAVLEEGIDELKLGLRHLLEF